MYILSSQLDTSSFQLGASLSSMKRHLVNASSGRNIVIGQRSFPPLGGALENYCGDVIITLILNTGKESIQYEHHRYAYRGYL